MALLRPIEMRHRMTSAYGCALLWVGLPSQTSSYRLALESWCSLNFCCLWGLIWQRCLADFEVLIMFSACSYFQCMWLRRTLFYVYHFVVESCSWMGFVSWVCVDLFRFPIRIFCSQFTWSLTQLKFWVGHKFGPWVVWLFYRWDSCWRSWSNG